MHLPVQQDEDEVEATEHSRMDLQVLCNAFATVVVALEGRGEGLGFCHGCSGPRREGGGGSVHVVRR